MILVNARLFGSVTTRGTPDMDKKICAVSLGSSLKKFLIVSILKRSYAGQKDGAKIAAVL